MDDEELKQLQWRCRRGLLENDLVLGRFLERYAAQLSEVDTAAFRKLLDYGDKALWALVNRRSEPADPDLLGVVELLRSCRRAE